MRITTLLIIGVVLTSCHTMHKSFSSHIEKKDSTSQQTVDSSHIYTIQGIGASKGDSSRMVKQSSEDHSGLRIEFSDTSASQVEITSDSTGFHIKATGKIKSVKADKSGLLSWSDSMHSKIDESLSMLVKDSLGSKTATNVTTHKESSDKTTEKKTVGFPWWIFLLVAVGVLIFRYRVILISLWKTLIQSLWKLIKL